MNTAQRCRLIQIRYGVNLSSSGLIHTICDGGYPSYKRNRVKYLKPSYTFNAARRERDEMGLQRDFIARLCTRLHQDRVLLYYDETSFRGKPPLHGLWIRVDKLWRPQDD